MHFFLLRPHKILTILLIVLCMSFEFTLPSVCAQNAPHNTPTANQSNSLKSQTRFALLIGANEAYNLHNNHYRLVNDYEMKVNTFYGK